MSERRPRLTPGADDGSLGAERAVLGAILLHNDVFPAALQSGEFFRAAHGQIFCAMTRLHARGDAIDLTTLRVELEATNEMAAVGGPAYISALIDGLPRSTNVSEYVAIVKSRALARAAVGDARRFIENVEANPSVIGNGVGSRFVESIQRTIDAAHAGPQRRRLFRSARELAATTAEEITWLVRGLVAVGAITELSGKAKLAGKTTLVLFFIRCVLDGDLCLGAAASQSAVVFLTEQPPVTIRGMLANAGLLERDDLSVLCHCDVSTWSWPEIVRLADEEAARIGAKLVIVDTLPQFAGLRGDAENNAGDALAVLGPVQQSASRGLAWLVTRHDRKGASEVGESGRGSSAFTGGVDIVLRLSRPDGNTRPTIRKLEGLARFRETPACLLLEKISIAVQDPGVKVWAESIDAFDVLGDEEAVVAAETRAALLKLLPEGEDGALSEQQAVDALEKPRAGIQRALKLLVAAGAALKVGAGRKGNPFRFFKPMNDVVQTSTLRERFEQNESEGLL